MRARIFQPAKTAMQAGRAKTKHWILEFEPSGRKRIDPLTGWTGSANTSEQVRLSFETAEAAIAYAEKNGMAYNLQKPHERHYRPKAYADNFAVGRRQPWSH